MAKKLTSAQKAAGASARKQEGNRRIKSSLKTFISKAEGLIRSGALEEAKEAIKQAQVALDKAAQKEVIHPNNAARRKSRLMHKLTQALATAAAPATPESQ